jgi:hypothetical protein
MRGKAANAAKASSAAAVAARFFPDLTTGMVTIPLRLTLTNF